jgi:hypothetical protein
MLNQPTLQATSIWRKQLYIRLQRRLHSQNKFSLCWDEWGNCVCAVDHAERGFGFNPSTTVDDTTGTFHFVANNYGC